MYLPSPDVMKMAALHLAHRFRSPGTRQNSATPTSPLASLNAPRKLPPLPAS
jgi:hypothetical protein